MGGSIIVMKPGDYQAWLSVGRPSENLAASGEHLFRELGCSGCHQNSSVIRAPRLEGVFGKPVPLNGGAIVLADEQYIRDSILLPASQIAAGYTNVMPSYQGHVSEEQLMQLIAYIKSLANQSPPEEPK
jgi:cytochrome c oxidase subunit 2